MIKEAKKIANGLHKRTYRVNAGDPKPDYLSNFVYEQPIDIKSKIKAYKKYGYDPKIMDQQIAKIKNDMKFSADKVSETLKTFGILNLPDLEEDTDEKFKVTKGKKEIFEQLTKPQSKNSTSRSKKSISSRKSSNPSNLPSKRLNASADTKSRKVKFGLEQSRQKQLDAHQGLENIKKLLNEPSATHTI